MNKVAAASAAATIQNKKMVHFKILDTTGFSTHDKPADEALEYMKAYIQSKGGWFYINTGVTNIDTTTPQDLEDASTITITNVVVGGTHDSEISNS